MDTPKPSCKLTGHNGNVFVLAGRVSEALREAGQAAKAQEMQARLFECGSYQEALRLFMEYVDVE